MTAKLPQAVVARYQSTKAGRAHLEALGRQAKVKLALAYLTLALEAAKAGGAPQTIKRVRLAISSAKGAQRHADLRVSSTYLAVEAQRSQPGAAKRARP